MNEETNSNCISADEMLLYLKGDPSLKSRDFIDIENHVDICISCQERLESLGDELSEEPARIGPAGPHFASGGDTGFLNKIKNALPPADFPGAESIIRALQSERDSPSVYPDISRNLLLVALAMQQDLITAEQLSHACAEWVIHREGPIGDQLLERGWIAREDHDSLQRSLSRKLERTGGDAHTALADVADAAIRDAIRSVDDPAIRNALGSLPPATGTAPVETLAKSQDPRPRYTLTSLHAEGGLGKVWLARDADLNREVALKEIRPRLANHADARRRFLKEAQITGQLEHPNIVSIYELTRRPEDDQPFYTMRFVRGRTLGEAIADYHRKRIAEASDPVEWIGLLSAFTSICNAIGYAHSRGVVHRDLKPANVVLGAFGEVIVLDWGLAKMVDRPGEADEGLPLMAVSDDAHARSTRAGSQLGTPAYMAPEQAEGRLNMIDARTDIYGLGAILFEVLAGRPPHVGATTILLNQIIEGETPRARSVVPTTPAALNAICAKAMAKDRSERYASASELADDVQRWIADEPVTAYHEPLIHRARRWAKKHRTGVASTTVALLLLTLFAWVSITTRQRTDALALDSLRQADDLLVKLSTEVTPATWINSIALTQRAIDQLESGGGSESLIREARARLKSLKLDRDTIDSLDEARLRGSLDKDGYYDINAMLDSYLATFRSYGIDVASLSVDEASRRIRSSRIADNLVATIDNWSMHGGGTVSRARLDEIANGVDLDPIRADIREAIFRRDVPRLRGLCESKEDRHKLGPRIHHVFNCIVNVDPSGSFPLLEAIRRENPADFWIYENLGEAYSEAKPPRIQEAVRCFSALLALRPDSPGVHAMLGSALAKQGNDDEAIAEYSDAIRMRPDDAGLHSNLGLILILGNKFDEAIAEFRDAIRLQPDDASAHYGRGMALKGMGKGDEAIAEFRDAIRLQPDHASAHSGLGETLMDQGGIDEAIAEFRDAIRISPDNALYRNSLGRALKQRGRLDDAIAEFREATRINSDFAEAHNNIGLVIIYQVNLDNILGGRDKLGEAIAEFREAVRIKPGFADAYENVGMALQLLGKGDEAIAAFRDAIRLQPSNAVYRNSLGGALKDRGRLDDAIAEFRNAVRINPDFADAHENIGIALEIQGKSDDAITEFRDAIRINPDLASAHRSLRDILMAQGKTGEAITEFRETIRLNPTDASGHNDLGMALYGQGKSDDAIAEFRNAIRILPDLAEAHSNLGMALQIQGKGDEAMAEFRDAIRFSPDLASAHYGLGLALVGQGRVTDAIAEYTDAIRINPDFAEAYCNLGQAFKEIGMFTEALDRLEKGHALGSRQSTWRYASGDWVLEARRFVELETILPSILRGEFSPEGPEAKLEVANVCFKKGFHRLAVKFYEETFTERPRLAHDLIGGHRYNAARAAAMAGSGLGKDDPLADDSTRVRMREKARDWLRADLRAWSRILEASAPAAPRVLSNIAPWKVSPYLSGIRDEATLAMLPEVEREAFRSLWADIEAVRAQASMAK